MVYRSTPELKKIQPGSMLYVFAPDLIQIDAALGQPFKVRRIREKLERDQICDVGYDGTWVSLP